MTISMNYVYEKGQYNVKTWLLCYTFIKKLKTANENKTLSIIQLQTSLKVRESWEGYHLNLDVFIQFEICTTILLEQEINKFKCKQYLHHRAD